MATIEYEDLIAEGERSDEEMVEVERAGGYAVLTMNDPAKHNVLCAAMMVQLRRAAEVLVADRRSASSCSRARAPPSRPAATCG